MIALLIFSSCDGIKYHWYQIMLRYLMVQNVDIANDRDIQHLHIDNQSLLGYEEEITLGMVNARLCPRRSKEESPDHL